jgi:hypothetical protein
MKEKILTDLKSQGFSVVKNLYNNDYCDLAVDEIEQAVKNEKIKKISEESEGVGNDIRLFKFENISKTALQFSMNNILSELASSYFGSKVKTHFVLAGKLSYDSIRISNSGGGWHRDSDSKQIKVIVYLDDVNSNNGPLQLISRSRKFDSKRRKHKFNDFFYFIKNFIKNGKLLPPRYSDESILSSFNKDQIHEITARKGDAIIFDSSLIHKGKNIEKGVRFSFTNYYFPDTKKSIESTKKSFESLFIVENGK